MCQNINRPRTLGDLFIFCNLSLINFTTFYNRNNIAILILSCSEGFSLHLRVKINHYILSQSDSFSPLKLASEVSSGDRDSAKGSFITHLE